MLALLEASQDVPVSSYNLDMSHMVLELLLIHFWKNDERL